MSGSDVLADIEQVDVFRIPLRDRFRGLDVREGMLLTGPAGVAEFSPFWDYDAVEAAPWSAAALEVACVGLPGAQRSAVPVNCTVPAVDPERARRIVAGPHGCTTAKVKVGERGQCLDDDLARVEAVRDALGPQGRIRVDANGAWDVDAAVRAIGRLQRFDLEYVEQPCATVEELAEVRRRVEMPIAADESIRRADDPIRVARLAAADVAVLKVQPLGGPRATLRLAERIGLPVVVSSALETSVGMAAGVAVAAALPELPYACGLGTVAMFCADVVRRPLTPTGGVLPVGTDVRPDPDALEAVRADPQTTRRWQRRLQDCAEVLAARVS